MVLSSQRKNLQFIFTAFCIGIFYFFITIPTLIPTYKGVLLFIILTILIGMGYYYILATLYKKFFPLTILVVIALLGNVLLYQELFYNHFDKRNSSEWSYAEKLVLSKLMTNSQFTTVHISPESSKVTAYIPADKNRYQYNTLTDRSYKSICSTPKVLCIIREGEKQRWNITNEEVKEIIPHFNGLTAYVLLYK
jgi:c-di-AMP phosphodiesterase-like protein